MSDTVPIGTRDAIIDGLAGARTARARDTFLRRHAELLQPGVVEDLYAREPSPRVIRAGAGSAAR